MAVYFYYGQEDFNLELEIQKHRQNLDKNFAAMNFKTYTNPKFADFIAILRSQPMMFGKMVVVINCLNYFSESFEDKQIAEIKSALDNNGENLDVILVAPLDRSGSGKLDARRKITKLLMKYNPKEFPMIKGYNIKEITAWIKNAARGRKLKLEDDALNLLVENMGNNLRMISLELDKLGLLAHPENVVTRKMVQENCITNDDFFDFTNYIVTNQRDKALLKFYKITEKRHPLETLAALQTMLRRWILIKMYGGKKSFIEISRMVNCHEFVAQRTFQEMKNTSLKELVDLKQRLMHAETRIKTFDANDEITEIQNAIMQ